MQGQHDILDRRDSLQRPLVLSLVLHGSIAAATIVYAILPMADVVQWGDPDSMGGGAVAITPVSKIPIAPRSGRVNPVANDTESRVPAPPPEVRTTRQTTADTAEEAIPVPSKKPAKRAATRRIQGKPSNASVPQENQLYSTSGAAAVTPMYGSTSGGGGVGVGGGNPFGNRFGAYVGLLRQRVARAWDTGQVDPRLQTAPVVIVTFEIQRSGSVRDVRFLQRSGHTTLDYSCQRAIMDASPFPPLPSAFERDSARIEFQFQLKR
jgi:periplasmic protein TonB